jgi:hypothetical protein
MAVPELPVTQEEQGSFAGDLVGMFNFFIDPIAASKLIRHKWFWVGPIVLEAIVTAVILYLTIPFMVHVAEVSPPPPNVDAATYQQRLPMIIGFYKFLPIIFVFVVVIFTLIGALILWGTCSVMQIKSKFGWLFNLLAGAGLISTLQGIAAFLVLKGKGEVNSQAELQPPLGLDIFMPETTNKMLLAFVGFFTPFQIWYIVILGLTFAYAFKVTKGKAFAAITPVVLVPLLFKLLGAAFQK